MLIVYQSLKWFFGDVLPTRWQYPLARLAARVVYGVNRRRRHVLLSNLTPVVGAARARQLAPKLLSNFFISEVDFFCRYASITEKIDVENVEALESCRRQGQNVMIATAHLGPWELGMPKLVELPLPLAALFAPYRNNAMAEWLHSHRHPAVEWIRGGKGSAESSLQALRNGKVLTLLADLPYSGRTKSMELCGARASFPVGPWAIAARARAAVLPAFIRRAPKNRYKITFHEPLLPNRKPLREQIERMMSQYVKIFEFYVKNYPDQWACLAPFWDTAS